MGYVIEAVHQWVSYGLYCWIAHHYVLIVEQSFVGPNHQVRHYGFYLAIFPIINELHTLWTGAGVALIASQ